MTNNLLNPDQISFEFTQLCSTIAALRHPKTGCPWDLEQTHASLKRYMIEEAYEAAEHMDNEESSAQLCEELGDVLLQVVLNAQVALDANQFSIVDVIKSINEKMIRRHPHVFGGQVVESKDELRKNWEAIKANENKKIVRHTSDGVFEKVIRYPATRQAFEIGKQASKIKFDWEEPLAVLAQLRSEISELEDALQESKGQTTEDVKCELGDVFFTWVQLCRHCDLEPETIGLEGNQKFLDRFKILEAIAVERGIDVRTATQATLENLWQEAKAKKNARTK